MPDEKTGSCSFSEIIIVDDKIAGYTVNMPLNVELKFERMTDIEITVPASTPLRAILNGV